MAEGDLVEDEGHALRLPYSLGGHDYLCNQRYSPPPPPPIFFTLREIS